VIIWIKL